MWRRWLCVLVTAALVIAIIIGIEIFSLASEDYPHRPSYSHNQYKPVYAALVQLMLRWWRGFRDWFDHDSITTIAIAATAVFTGTLWRATNRLWETSQEHGRHMERSVEAAKRSAEISRQALVTTQRAFVFLNEFDADGVPTSGASFLTGDGGFESPSLHGRVGCDPDPSATRAAR